MNNLPSFDSYFAFLNNNRGRIQRVFFVLALISLILNFRNNMTISQLGGNPLLYQDIDPVYWLFMILDIPKIIGIEFPILYDIILILSCVASIVWPRQNISSIVFFIGYFIYFILFNMMAGHHYHMVGLAFMSFPFVFRSDKKFAYAFTFLRFVFCFVMFSAAAWKIYRGNLGHTDQLFSFMSAYHAENLIAKNSSMSASIVSWLLPHKLFLHFLWLCMIALQAFYVVGLFTTRYDRLLLVNYILFFVGGWLLLNIYIYDNLLFLLTLAPILYIFNFSSRSANTVRSLIAFLFRILFRIKAMEKHFYGFYVHLFKPYNLFREVSKRIIYKKNIKLELDVGDWIQQNLYFLGKYQDREVMFTKNFLSAGNVFVDVGSNIGIFSMVASNIVGDEGKVVAFEPYSVNYNKLVRHVEINEKSNIITEKKALSDKYETIKMYIDSGENNLGMVTAFPEKFTSYEEVDAISLDNYLAEKNLNRIDLIKIDIEGYELYALTGMRETIIKFRPALIVEINNTILSNAGKSGNDILQFFSRLGYKRAYIDKKGNITDEITSSEQPDNSLFVYGGNKSQED